jgi:hypothetical protein
LSLWDSVAGIDDIENSPGFDGVGIAATDPLQAVEDRVDMWALGFREKEAKQE